MAALEGPSRTEPADPEPHVWNVRSRSMIQQDHVNMMSDCPYIRKTTRVTRNERSGPGQVKYSVRSSPGRCDLSPAIRHVWSGVEPLRCYPWILGRAAGLKPPDPLPWLASDTLITASSCYRLDRPTQRRDPWIIDVLPSKRSIVHLSPSHPSRPSAGPKYSEVTEPSYSTCQNPSLIRGCPVRPRVRSLPFTWL